MLHGGGGGEASAESGAEGDIDFEESVWRISGQWTRDGERVEYAKTKKSLRRVPLSPEMVKKLAARKLANGAGDDAYIFASDSNGNPLSRTNFRRRAWNTAVANSKLTDDRPGLAGCGQHLSNASGRRARGRDCGPTVEQVHLCIDHQQRRDRCRVVLHTSRLPDSGGLGLAAGSEAGIASAARPKLPQLPEDARPRAVADPWTDRTGASSDTTRTESVPAAPGQACWRSAEVRPAVLFLNDVCRESV
jgi:hypothetical protein